MNNIKKICATLLIGCMLVALSACGKTSADNENPDVNDNYYENVEQDNPAKNDNADSQIASSTEEDGLLFSTEYAVVDYVENAIIVSKNDGRLYGMLDHNGTEVIPVKFDSLEFLNKTNYLEGKNENIYLLAQYEDDFIIFNKKGSEILRNKVGIYSADSEFTTGDVPYFRVENKLYSEKLEYIGTKPNPTSDSDITVLSENCYIISLNNGDGLYLDRYFYDYKGNLINQITGYSGIPFTTMKDDEYIIAYLRKDENRTVFHIDRNGKTLNEETMSANEFKEKYMSKPEYNLYESNSTWKLEDLNGNPLLDERYYDLIEAGGDNYCILLTNDNNEVCLFNRQGKLYIDYGMLTYNQGTLKMLTFDSSKTVNEIYEGKESIIITCASLNGGYDIYYYSAK